MRMPFDPRTLLFACLSVVLFCGCPKKRQKGTVEVIEFDGRGNYHCYAVQDDSPGFAPNAAMRDDRYRKVFENGRAFVYFFPDETPAKLGYKKKVNADEDYFIFENYAPGEDGYWKGHTGHQAPWERDVAFFTKISSFSRPPLYINGSLIESSFIYSTETDARNGFQKKRINIEGPITWSFSISTGTLNPVGFNQDPTLIEVATSTTQSGKHTLIVNKQNWNILPPVPGTWTATVCTPAKQLTWMFNCNGNGSLISPDCGGACTSYTFPFSYTLTETAVNVSYTTPPPITCTPSGTIAPAKPNNESINFIFLTTGELRLTRGSVTYTLKKQSGC